MNQLPATVVTIILVILTILLVIGMVSCNEADDRHLDQIPPYVKHHEHQKEVTY